VGSEALKATYSLDNKNCGFGVCALHSIPVGNNAIGFGSFVGKKKKEEEREDNTN
jgi:hypothetical protein